MQIRNGKIYQLRLFIKLSKLALVFIYFSCIPNLQQEWRRTFIFPISKSDENRLRLMAESIWIELPKAKYQGPELKPKPIQNSDLLNLYYYLRSFISFAELSKLLSVPIYISGPHTDDTIIINHKSKFGHYHPEFPIRIRKYFLPAMSDASFRSLTQSNYEKFIKNLARTYFVVYLKLHSNKEFFQKEVERYNELVTEKRLDPFYIERFVLFMKKDYTDGEDIEESAKFKFYDGDDEFNEDIVKHAVGFWLRRRIDQTDLSFFHGLKDLIFLYDRVFYESRLEIIEDSQQVDPGQLK